MDYWQHDFRAFLSGMIKCESNGLAPTYLQTTFLPPPVTLLQTKLPTTCVFLTTVHLHPFFPSKYFPNSTSSDFSIIFSKPIYLQTFGFYSISRHESTCRRVNKNREF